MCALIRQTIRILYPSSAKAPEHEVQQIVDSQTLSFSPTLQPKYSSNFFPLVFTVGFFAILIPLRRKYIKIYGLILARTVHVAQKYTGKLLLLTGTTFRVESGIRLSSREMRHRRIIMRQFITDSC
jgi:hypothetical protein